VTGKGIDELKYAIAERVDQIKQIDIASTVDDVESA